SEDSISKDFPVWRSRQKLVVIPCSLGKHAVTSDALFTLVTEGMTLRPTLYAPSRHKRLRVGISLRSTYSGPNPSTRTMRILRPGAARALGVSEPEARTPNRKCLRVFMFLMLGNFARWKLLEHGVSFVSQFLHQADLRSVIPVGRQPLHQAEKLLPRAGFAARVHCFAQRRKQLHLLRLAQLDELLAEPAARLLADPCQTGLKAPLMLRICADHLVDILRHAGADRSGRFRLRYDPLGHLAHGFELGRRKRLGDVRTAVRRLRRRGDVDVLSIQLVGGERKSASRPDR